MKKWGAMLLCACLLTGLFAVTASAASGSSNMLSVSAPAANSSGSIEYLQGDTMTFFASIYAGMRSNSVYACGLTSTAVAPDDLFKTNSVVGSIQTGNIQYPAQFTYDGTTWNMAMTLNTKNIPVGNYRFYFVSVWQDNTIASAYFYRDVTIRSAETPSSWAKSEVDKAIAKYLVPSEMQNRYTSPAPRDAFAKLVTGLISAKTGLSIERYIGRKGLDLVTNPFSDTSEAYVIAANKLDIIDGVGDGKFSPAGSLTREQAATMIWRAAKALGVNVGTAKTVSFADKAKISSWALEAVAYVSSKSIMNGTGNNNFSPKGTYTYEQCYISILRFYNSMAGFTVNTSPIKPKTSEPKAMSVPFTSAGCSYTIASAAADSDIVPGDLTANDKPFVVRFTSNTPPTFPQVTALGTQAYLLTPGGAVYYSTLYSGWDETYKTCLLGFSIPKTIDVSTLTLVCNGEWRRLDGTASSFESKSMSTPIKLSDSLSVVLSKAEIGTALSNQTADQKTVYLYFDPQGTVFSSGSYSALNDGYLRAPDGKQYKYASSEYRMGEPYCLAYLIPKGLEVSTLAFVLGDEARALE